MVPAPSSSACLMPFALMLYQPGKFAVLVSLLHFQKFLSTIYVFHWFQLPVSPQGFPRLSPCARKANCPAWSVYIFVCLCLVVCHCHEVYGNPSKTIRIQVNWSPFKNQQLCRFAVTLIKPVALYVVYPRQVFATHAGYLHPQAGISAYSPLSSYVYMLFYANMLLATHTGVMIYVCCAILCFYVHAMCFYDSQTRVLSSSPWVFWLLPVWYQFTCNPKVTFRWPVVCTVPWFNSSLHFIVVFA